MSRMVRVILFVIAVSSITAQGNIVDSLGFVSPVDHVIRLTGNFMELRPNHFHAGIDIKSTNGQPGDVIRTVHDGYISRIKIQSGGYGNVLYIDHPNGYTSVYAHLDEFAPRLEKYVKEIQYALESFEVDIYLPDSLFTYRQGTRIGNMGNSGRSFGPHLHFELRKTESETPVNPELLGIGPTDKSAPVLESLHLHTIGAEGNILSKTTKYFKPNHDGYQLHSDLIEIKGHQLGVGVQMYDRMDGSWNKNGVYGFRLEVDGVEQFSWQATDFSFSETRLINAFWDYEKKKVNGQKVYLMYRSACNHSHFYNGHQDGIIDLSDGLTKAVKIIVSDLHGNISELNFDVKGEATFKERVSKDLTSCDSISTFEEGYFDVQFEENAFFSPVSIDVKYYQEKIEGQDCLALSVGKSTIPVNGYYTISCPIPQGTINQWTLASKDYKNRLIHFGGDTLNGRFVVKVDQLGDFFLYKDDKAPQVTPISFSIGLTTPWKIRITDNLIDDGRARELNYRATLNGEWIRMKYDKKNDMLLFDDKDRISTGPMTFQLVVWDHCGNVQNYSKII